MATAVPVVASDLDGMREVLSNEKNALLVAATDTAAFIQRVCDLIENATLRKRLADAALETARAQFCANTMTRKVEEIYSRYLTVR